LIKISTVNQRIKSKLYVFAEKYPQQITKVMYSFIHIKTLRSADTFQTFF
jgi:hypothetical protein